MKNKLRKAVMRKSQLKTTYLRSKTKEKFKIHKNLWWPIAATVKN